MRNIVTIALMGISLNLFGQNMSLQDSLQINSNQRILKNLAGLPQGITLGGYGEILYNNPENLNSELDVQRLVLLFGYKFDERVQFVTEIEFEHVKEVYVEQAFVNYNLTQGLNLRAGLMLVPMGIINEFHEPTIFNGVERPSLDKYIIPTTWREIGMGLSGRLNGISARYQAYLFNGFLSHNGENGLLKGSNGLRSGRQKGAESTMNHINFAGKFDFYGIRGLRLGLSGYQGKTQAVDGQNEIPGSEIGISMLGLDARYAYRKFSARGQYLRASLHDTDLYNELTGRDLGSELMGYYLEAAYNVLPFNKKQRLVGFVRYENFNTHHEVGSLISKNEAFHRKEWTLGFSYHIAPGAVYKIDYQTKSTAISNSKKGQFNMGVGVWF
ncbi:MAG: hypothetical protein P8I42_02265 [Flavobacteriaceae bacterium]|nr:hypothetical protein [Flavobacteriaceae bacterium]MDG1911631.1 hypothetical protein [Flavobacteriaceae bacterium]